MKGLLTLLAACWVWGAATAAPVELTLPNHLTARAEYRKGDADKPAVLLLHGFLQTHEFPVIHRMTEGVADTGRTVLAPTLSLGVTHRKQSMACEAIHTHSMADGAREIQVWVDWLKARHPGPIILVGHSFGSVELLSYLSGKPDPAVIKFIAVSIVEGRLELKEAALEALIRQTRAQARAGEPATVSRPFSFCKNYRATPASLVTYLEWTPKRVVQASSRLRLPNVYVMGGRDDRLGTGWIERLKRATRVVVIPGANHFMDGEHEFDLLDVLLEELKSA